MFGHRHDQRVIQLIEEMVEEGAKPAWNWKPPENKTKNWINKIKAAI